MYRHYEKVFSNNCSCFKHVLRKCCYVRTKGYMRISLQLHAFGQRIFMGCFIVYLASNGFEKSHACSLSVCLMDVTTEAVGKLQDDIHMSICKYKTIDSTNILL